MKYILVIMSTYFGFVNAKPVSHVAWDKLLKSHVSAVGNVDYKGFIKDKAALDAYLKTLSDNPPNSAWSSDEQKAFWINAYNAWTVSLVIRNYPVKSIKDIGGLLKSPWDIEVADIGGRKYTLNQMEHDILRKQFKDPRIHFAIVCASRSCPSLRAGAFEANRLSTQLDEQVVLFLADGSKNTITSQEIRISKIFDWFKDDFSGSVAGFINKYSKITIPDASSLSYQSYDWSLNE